MTFSVALAVYFILWWVVFFAILPFGVRSQHEEPEIAAGTDPGAPVRPHLLVKAIVTTVITAVVFGTGYWLFASGTLTLESFPLPFAMPKV
jgi:predicted secreted protein